MKEFHFKSWMIGALRRASYKYPPRYLALNNARVSRGVYRCAICKGDHPRKNVQVDHVEPVIGMEGFVDWQVYVTRMFPDISGFQLLCKPCHNKKSKEENAKRRSVKKSKV